MSPKFKGGSEDWLDNKDSRSGTNPKKKAARSKRDRESVAAPEANGTVAEVFPSLARVKSDAGASILCAYRRSKLPSQTQYRERSPVAVGDRVHFEATDSRNGVIDYIAPRSSQLIRAAPGREAGNVHVVAANVDLVVMVAAAKNPDFSPGLIDRILVGTGHQKVTPIICINKVDLLMSEDQRPWSIYRELGYEVHEVSAHGSIGIEALRSRILGTRAAFFGHSGVGKTSLLRTLLEADIGKVGQVNEFTGKGRHTTTGAILLDAPGGTHWIDTPGVREFGLVGIEPEELAGYFPELAPLECLAQSCSHSGEEGCLALTCPRHDSYRRLLDSLRSGEN